MCEIKDLKDKVYVPIKWIKSEEKDGPIANEVVPCPTGMAIVVNDNRNKDGYGSVKVYIKREELDCWLDIYKDPVDNKEKYYFNIRNNDTNLGKTCYVTDENTCPPVGDIMDAEVVSYWDGDQEEDPYSSGITDPYSLNWEN